MKAIIKIILITIFILSVLIIYADPPNPPDPGGPPGSGGTPVGAPVEANIYILMALGLVYIAIKFLQNRNKEREKHQAGKIT